LKYPTIFNSADLAVITKIDLSRAVDFDRRVAYAALQDVRPEIDIIELSAKTGEGLKTWIGRLDERAPIARGAVRIESA
jgi:hydrogenase nickel incorporation protein HypB